MKTGVVRTAICYLVVVEPDRSIRCQTPEKDENQRKVLCSCSFLEKCIKIDNTLVNTKRYRFALAHEIGHYFLHNKIQINQEAYEKMSDSQYNISLDKYIIENERNWIEWQANQFASSLIMPKKLFYYYFNNARVNIGLAPNRQLYVDEQPCNQKSFNYVINYLSNQFLTTKTSIIYRLNSLNLLKENYRMKSIGQIISEMLDE